PRAVDADHQDLRVGRGELAARLVVLLQLRGAAGRERGREERQHDVLLALVVAQLRGLGLGAAVRRGNAIGQREVRRGFTDLDGGRGRRRWLLGLRGGRGG